MEDNTLRCSAHTTDRFPAEIDYFDNFPMNLLDDDDLDDDDDHRAVCASDEFDSE